MINDAQEFISLCDSELASDVTRSIRDESTVEVWLELVLNFPAHRIDVAQNDTIPSEIMKALVEQGDEITRSILAQKRKLPLDLFGLLSNDSSPLVRQKIAANKKTPVELVRDLTTDADENVARVAKFRLTA